MALHKLYTISLAPPHKRVVVKCTSHDIYRLYEEIKPLKLHLDQHTQECVDRNVFDDEAAQVIYNTHRLAVLDKSPYIIQDSTSRDLVILMLKTQAIHFSSNNLTCNIGDTLMYRVITLTDTTPIDIMSKTVSHDDIVELLFYCRRSCPEYLSTALINHDTTKPLNDEAATYIYNIASLRRHMNRASMYQDQDTLYFLGRLVLQEEDQNYTTHKAEVWDTDIKTNSHSTDEQFFTNHRYVSDHQALRRLEDIRPYIVADVDSPFYYAIKHKVFTNRIVQDIVDADNIRYMIQHPRTYTDVKMRNRLIEHLNGSLKHISLNIKNMELIDKPSLWGRLVSWFHRLH